MTKPDLSSHITGLQAHHDRLGKVSVVDLFGEDPARFGNMSLSLGSMRFDYSKNRLDKSALDALLAMAAETGLESRRDAMFGAQRINQTEDRAVLHTALRNRSDRAVLLDGHDVMPGVNQVLARMGAFSREVRQGSYKPSGKPVRDVVNIGIGGSDLGPRMAVAALKPFHDGPPVHFVANIDGADITDVLAGLEPETTLFIVASKTFTTRETMTNAQTARKWIESAVGEERAARHFVALSTNAEATQAFGIPAERTFGFWDWVGGRYSVWSAVGLSLMIAVGESDFLQFLEGGHDVDEHFRTAPLAGNIPVLMGLIGIWHRNVCGYPAHAVLPYDQRLVHFPRWLQQLDMESNGKSTAVDGGPVRQATGPVVFGEPGTNGQHAFFQLLHQGTDIVPADFLVAARGHEPGLDHQHRSLVANCLAQSKALMVGRNLEEAGGNPHRVFSGNRPSNTFLYARLDPHTLGMLLALYEHKIFVQGALWGINSFDQWGVELGKELASRLEPALASRQGADDPDPSTRGLLDSFHALRDG